MQGTDRGRTEHSLPDRKSLLRAPLPCVLLRPPQGLGYGILAGSTLVKVPQVLNVVRARSAAGLAPLACELETLGLLIAVTYGFIMGLPFSAFGETVVGAGHGGQWTRAPARELGPPTCDAH